MGFSYYAQYWLLLKNIYGMELLYWLLTHNLSPLQSFYVCKLMTVKKLISSFYHQF